MRRNLSSRFSERTNRDEDESLSSSRPSLEEQSQSCGNEHSTPSTPKQAQSRRPSEANLRGRFSSRSNVNESSSLLESQNYRQQSYSSFTSLMPGTPRHTTGTQNSQSASLRPGRHHARSATFAQRLVNGIGTDKRQATFGRPSVIPLGIWANIDLLYRF